MKPRLPKRLVWRGAEFFEYPPQTRTILLGAMVTRPVRLAMPYLFFVPRFQRVFASSVPSQGDNIPPLLYTLPLPNIYRNGGVCWYSEIPPEEKFIERFWTSPFNHYTGDWGPACAGWPKFKDKLLTVGPWEKLTEDKTFPAQLDQIYWSHPSWMAP